MNRADALVTPLDASVSQRQAHPPRARAAPIGAALAVAAAAVGVALLGPSPSGNRPAQPAATASTASSVSTSPRCPAGGIASDFLVDTTRPGKKTDAEISDAARALLVYSQTNRAEKQMARSWRSELFNVGPRKKTVLFTEKGGSQQASVSFFEDHGDWYLETAYECSARRVATGVTKGRPGDRAQVATAHPSS